MKPKQFRPAIFLDRDGVITRVLTERGPRETAQTATDVELLPGAKNGLRLLQQAGFILAVVTNQPNVAKGKSSRDDVNQINARITELLQPEVILDGSYACYHHPDKQQVVVPELLQECACRKPQPGLLRQAIDQLPIDLERSWLIGDAETDILAGMAAGLPAERCVLISRTDSPTHAVIQPDLQAAAQYIINQS